MEQQDPHKTRVPWYLSGKTDKPKSSSNNLDKKIEGMEAHIGRIRNGLNQLQEQLRQLRDQLESGKQSAERDDTEHQDPFTGSTAIAN